MKFLRHIQNKFELSGNTTSSQEEQHAFRYDNVQVLSEYFASKMPQLVLPFFFEALARFEKCPDVIQRHLLVMLLPWLEVLYV